MISLIFGLFVLELLFPGVHGQTPPPLGGKDRPNYPYVTAPMSSQERKICETAELRDLKEGLYYGGQPLRWRAALECCQMKGYGLLSHPYRHKNIFKALSGGNSTWVGGNDLLQPRTLEWVNGELIPSGSPALAQGEPQLNGYGNCGLADQNGLMSTIGCDAEFPFLCEDIPPPGGISPSDIDLEICKSIEYEESESGYMRQKNISPSTTVNRPLASKCCSSKGWQLASLKDLTSEQQTSLAKLLGPKESHPYWTSGWNVNTPNNIFLWEANHIQIPEDDQLWLARAAFQIGGKEIILFHRRNCVQVQNKGEVVKNSTTMRQKKIYKPKIRDISCNVKLPILCEVNVHRGNSCCVATDSETLLTKRPPNQFEFLSPAGIAEKLETAVSLHRHLNPSKVTGLDWPSVWNKYYLEKSGQGPVPFSPIPTRSNQSLLGCPSTYFAYVQYEVQCGTTKLMYVEQKEVTFQNSSFGCPVPGNCVSPCQASDRWILHGKHEIFQQKASTLGRAGKATQCLKFQPPIDPTDFQNALIQNEFIATRSPSPSTGVDWGDFLAKLRTGIIPEESVYHIKDGDVPSGSFMKIYRLQGKCGNYTTTGIQFYKLVLFKTGDKAGNCEIAKEQKVPFENC